MLRRDFSGERYGKLTVISYVGKAKDGHSEWLCKCDCGNETILRSNNLQRAKSCGCITNALFDDSVIGQRFGKLTVVKRAPKGKWKDELWECKCDCGKTRIVAARHLLHGDALSCGCTRKNYERRSWKCGGKDNPSYKHGDAMRGHRNRLYSIYHDMLRRCECEYRDDFKDYGGRGISVCVEWRESYEVFRDWALANGYSDDLTLDRIDVNGNYCPENCRWADKYEQARNRRNNHYVEVDGCSMPLVAACEALNLPYDVIRSRVQRGWSENDALFVPIGGKRAKN